MRLDSRASVGEHPLMPTTAVTLSLDLLPVRSLNAAARVELDEEGDRFIRWLEPDATTFGIHLAR